MPEIFCTTLYTRCNRRSIIAVRLRMLTFTHLHFRMRVRYSSAADVYYRRLEDDIVPGKDDVKSWINGIQSMTSMFRKEEHDWKMVSF